LAEVQPGRRRSPLKVVYIYNLERGSIASVGIYAEGSRKLAALTGDTVCDVIHDGFYQKESQYSSFLTPYIGTYSTRLMTAATCKLYTNLAPLSNDCFVFFLCFKIYFILVGHTNSSQQMCNLLISLFIAKGITLQGHYSQ
jgi:hypothetical protein